MDEAICHFSDVTGASPSVAEYYLEACNGNLENAIHQYLENPTDEGPLDELPQPVRTDIDLTAQDIEDPDWNPSPQVSPTGSGHMGRGEGLDEDHELQRALEESLRGGGSSSIEVDMESPRVGFGPVGSSTPAGSGGQQAQVATDGPDLIVEGHAIDANQIPSPPPNAAQTFEPQNWVPSDRPEFPPDVDLHEAEMYEAAHFGVPYNGRIPRYAPPRSPSPDTKARRVMVSNQDQEYNESLKADREKAEAAEREAHEAKERERLQQEELLAAANRKAEEQEHLLRLMETKKSNIPDEPSESAPNTIALVIRLPDGSKLSRRFDMSTPLQVLFDFVDVEVEGKGNLAPGSYNLLRQFPKKVYVPDDVEGSLEAVGLTTDEALFAMKRG